MSFETAPNTPPANASEHNSEAAAEGFEHSEGIPAELQETIENLDDMQFSRLSETLDMMGGEDIDSLRHVTEDTELVAEMIQSIADTEDPTERLEKSRQLAPYL